MQNVVQCLTLLSCILSMIMSSSVNDELINQLDRHIRLFLSAVDVLSDAVDDTKEKPVWISSYTYMCLMNVPDMMRRYGVIRHYWEGKYFGEGILRDVKPLISHLYVNWEVNATKRLYQNMGMKCVLNSLQDLKNTHKCKTSCNHVTYGSYASAITYFKSMMPISILVSDNFECLVHIKGRSCCKIHRIQHYCTKFELAYARWKLHAVTEWSDSTIRDSTPGIMLPMPSAKISNSYSGEEGIYAVLTAEWTEMDMHGTFRFSRASWVNYDSESDKYVQGVEM